MEVIRGIYNVKPHHRGCVATVGNFDGVHHGHQMLLAHLIAKSEELGVPSVLITFEPQPREFFQGASVPARLTRFREKITLLQQSGIDRVLCLPFNGAMAKVEARTVIEEFLVRRLGVEYLVVGDDFRFGQGAEGDYALLKAAGDKHGFGVSHLGTLTFEHERVSSSRIRELLGMGNLEAAERLLGHSYFIMGRVVYGRQLGRQLGTPTANIQLRRYHSALSGVFAVEVTCEDKNYNGVANIGIRPTVEGKEPLLEVHLFDWDGDLYGQLLTVTFHKKLRKEQKFESLEALKKQIQLDKQNALQYLETVNQ
jgi:riboflavin kinase/FMN adenylyltransferase